MAFESQKQYQEATAHSSTDPLQGVLAVRRDADTSSVAEGQYEPLHTNATGRLKVAVHAGAYDTVTGTITANGQTVVCDVSRAGSVTVSVSGTYAGLNMTFEIFDGAVWLGVLAQQTDVQGVVLLSGVLTANTTRGWDVAPLLGVSQLRVRATAFTSGTANIRITPSFNAPELAPNVSGAVTVSSGVITTVSTVTAVTTVGTVTGGGVASGTADTGNPIKIGAVARITNPAAVADGARVNFIADKMGKQLVVGSIRDQKVQQNTTITNSTAETTILTAVAAVFLDVYGLIIANTSATDCSVVIKDATGGTTRFVFAVRAGDTRTFMVSESAAHSQAAVNTSWTATCSASVSSIIVTALAVKNL